MQDDGNFVLYSKGNGIATWATGTDKNNGATLRIQDDGNLVVYKSESGLGTQQSLYSANKAYRMVVQGDGNLVKSLLIIKG